MRIYVASSWKNLHVAEVVEFLRGQGHRVFDFTHPGGNEGFRWAQIGLSDGHTLTDYLSALDHLRAEQGFGLDMANLACCECCVLVLPSGRSAHLEAGYAAGAGKRLVIYWPEYDGPDLMYKIAHAVVKDLFALASAVGK